MQDKNNKYEIKFDLFDFYYIEDLKKLFKIIPELASLCQVNNNLNLPSNTISKQLLTDEIENINMSNYQTKINKFIFFRTVLTKLKSYFGVNESFTIMKTISILINEINNIEKYLTLIRYNSKNNLKTHTKNELKNEKDINKSSIKFEKIRKVNSKNINSNQQTTKKSNGLNNPFSNSIDITIPCNPNYTNTNKKKKVYFRVLDNGLKKESKTEIIHSINPKINNSKLKHININLNETERKVSNCNLSLYNLKKYEFQKMIADNKLASHEGLKIYIDSNDNAQNYSTSYDINNSKPKKDHISKITNKSDLFNNNNNLYINIYGQKKNNDLISSEIASLKFQPKSNDESNIEKETKIINNNILNVSLLNNIETDEFNIFELDKLYSKRILPLIGNYIFNRFGFHNIIKYSMFKNWCQKIAEGYNRKNPYHTDLHAGDITQTCLVFFKMGKINEICKLNQLSKCALFLSCICHDFKHPGVNNNFLRYTKNVLAIKYNDNSILENMHISEAFKLTIDFSNCDIFSGMNSENYREIRKQMISCVLFTDMDKHKLTIDFMKEILNNNNKKEDEKINQDQSYMNLLIHSADISNPTKKYTIYLKWAERILEEFLQQGDKEKELGIKCSYDRETMEISQNQLSFINYIEIPFYTEFVEIFPKLKYLMNNLNNNKNRILLIQEKEKENKKNKNQKKLYSLY